MLREKGSFPPFAPPDQHDPQAAEASEAFEALSRRFMAELPDQVEGIAAACRDIALEGVPAAARAQRIAHGLAGSGATFGMPAVTAVAREINALLCDVVNGGADRAGLLAPTITRLVAELSRVARAPITVQSAEASSLAPTHETVNPFRGQRLVGSFSVGVLELDPPQAHMVAAQLVHFGYDVRVIPAGDELMPHHVKGLSAAICDLPLADRLRRVAPGLPLVGMLARDDLALRLQAVRAGFASLVSRPCDAGELARALERLTPTEVAPSERVLIVEDDGKLARLYAMTLENAGMVVSVLEDPLALLERVVEFQPEMILMDLYLPHCTGIELAAVLRQDDRVVGVPIVFLTAETRPTSALAALEVGADDFLSKPVPPATLISVVRSRIDRARIVRSFMDRDSLTGLLNHSRTIERVEQEFSRARRHRSPFCLVLLDLDHFKRVNDTQGHVVGDRVLKSLGALFRQRLRRSDIIGRCGGEEFAVLLPDTTVSDAVNVMNGLRERFGELAHGTQGEPLHVTFSAGIACSEDWASTSLLWEAADTGLYAAKAAGRNAVRLADPEALGRRASSQSSER